MFSLARIEGIVRHLLRFGASAADAQDLAQEVLVLAWVKRHELEPAQLDAWMYGAAKNVYRNFLRADRRAKVKVSMDGELPDAAASARGAPPEEALALQAAVRELPPNQQDVIWLHEFEGYTLVETAAFVEAPVDTVKDRLKRAREALRTRLTDYAGIIGREREQTRKVARAAAAAVLAGFVGTLSAGASAASLANSGTSLTGANAGGSAMAVTAPSLVGWSSLAAGALAGAVLTFAGMTWRQAAGSVEAGPAKASWVQTLSEVRALPAPSSGRVATAPLPSAAAALVSPLAPTMGAKASPPSTNVDAMAVDPEVQRLEQARNALRDGRSDDALTQLAAHERDFAHSQLAEERDVLIIQCHVRSGDMSAAHASIAYYRRQYPKGTLRGKVETLAQALAPD